VLRTLATPALKQNTDEENSISVLHAASDPTNHTNGDYLKFYSIDKKIIQNNLSENVPKKFKELSKALSEHTLMLRKPALKIIHQLENTDTSNKFVIYGPQGCGKSMSLLHVLHYAIQKDWVIVYIPNGFRLVDSQTATEVQSCQWRPGRFDQPKESLIWLNSFRQLNFNYLQNNSTTQEYKWGKREMTEKGRPLLELIDQGISRSLYANDAVGAILKELRINTSTNILFAVDSFNGLYERSSHKVDGKMVDAQNLSLVHHFKKLMSPSYNLGDRSSYVFALSQSGQYMGTKLTDLLEEDLLLNNEALEDLGEFHHIKMENYNQREFEAIMKFYKSKNWLTRDLSDSLLNEVHFLTGGNGASVSKYAAFI